MSTGSDRTKNEKDGSLRARVVRFRDSDTPPSVSWVTGVRESRKTEPGSGKNQSKKQSRRPAPKRRRRSWSSGPASVSGFLRQTFARRRAYDQCWVCIGDVGLAAWLVSPSSGSGPGVHLCRVCGEWLKKRYPGEADFQKLDVSGETPTKRRRGSVWNVGSGQTKKPGSHSS